ncbi:unnamed protein product [Aphanomyces euteiches]|uniref:CBM1 domain-containing protein n=1 Tax=Aphanomyces euteiches TaxID=100861 RepID=A0A6G0WYN4_9STRA|nr:hypothetical protein Ae201684_010314 [Aphanomyces euteiches]KAH9090491.1 hypothetical protein Ae201684P_014292 [Aphanomyces euteiches]KAH9145182.1 hypothetical protein AeRB84_010911 [Aphanomyces euteiches]
MKVSIVSSALSLAALAYSASSANLCNAVEPYSYVTAATQYPELKNAIQALSANPIATWYTDRGSNQVAQILSACGNSVPTIVVYGLPNKDCGEGGFSNGGDNTNTQQYTAWIQTLVSLVGNKEVIYILEPDAVGLTSTGGCGVTNGYQNNLKVALGLLSTNPNAHIYVDVASWATQSAAVSILADLKKAGRLQGIAINTSNYRATSELTALCNTYSSATGGLHCVFDTSRNFNGASSNEWCNARFGGVGVPPTSNTGNPLVDYYLWIKPPGESDGQCTGQSADAMIGPAAGTFFYDGFKTLWNQGYYVKQLGMAPIGSGGEPPVTSSPSTTVQPTSTPTPTTSRATPAPTTSRPPSTPSVQPTPTPTTSSPSGGVAQPWAQCGGSGYTGPTTCTQGYKCSYSNAWYSQCVPSSN